MRERRRRRERERKREEKEKEEIERKKRKSYCVEGVSKNSLSTRFNSCGARGYTNYNAPDEHT